LDPLARNRVGTKRGQTRMTPGFQPCPPSSNQNVVPLPTLPVWPNTDQLASSAAGDRVRPINLLQQETALVTGNSGAVAFLEVQGPPLPTKSRSLQDGGMFASANAVDDRNSMPLHDTWKSIVQSTAPLLSARPTRKRMSWPVAQT
jgi:hypothetical protein